VVAQLLSKGAEIVNLDFKPPARPDQQSIWRKCDVRDRGDVALAVTAFDPHYILHLASDIDVTLKRIEEYATTVEGTRNVVAAAQRLINLRRFIHISSQFVVTPGVRPKSETDLQPYTLYGEAKARSELIVRQSILIDWLILRPAIIWGPRHPSFSDAIWKYLANGRYLHPVARKRILRCYGYVRNTAAQMVAFLEADLSTTSSRVFYLGDGAIDHDLWADGFAIAFTGKHARRVPKHALLALGLAGDGLRMLGVRFPMDTGRYFRMTTSSDVDLAPTFAIVGPPMITMADGIKETVEWLAQLEPPLFGVRIR